jgi:hypothetical protein
VAGFGDLFARLDPDPRIGGEHKHQLRCGQVGEYSIEDVFVERPSIEVVAQHLGTARVPQL